MLFASHQMPNANLTITMKTELLKTDVCPLTTMSVTLNPTRNVLEIFDSEKLWQWCWLGLMFFFVSQPLYKSKSLSSSSSRVVKAQVQVIT